MATKLHVKKDDLVEVISGDERGKRGKIVRVEPDKQRVYVEGLNLQQRHRKARKADEVSRIDTRPGPIHVSNVRKVEG